MTDRTNDRIRQFEAAALPHLDAAYNIARWLMRDDHEAQDAVQESYLRALKFFGGFRGGNARPWLLGIVRNTCYTCLKDKGRLGEQVEFDEARDSRTDGLVLAEGADDPESRLMHKLNKERIDAAIRALPPPFREAIVLRELEELSYEEIAQVAAIPVGTVMSRLARARALLRAALGRDDPEEQRK